MLVVGSQEQELWAWQEGGRKGTTATFCKEGKGLAKALCSLSQSAPRLREVSTWKPRDTTGLTLHKCPQPLGKYHTLKIVPVLSGLTGSPRGGQGAEGLGSARLPLDKHLSGASPSSQDSLTK
jgi:hypothetical protein